MAALMLRHQRQTHQGLHRPLRAQHRIGKLKQRIPARGQTGIQLTAEGG
jgi:hypothetical protein